MLDLVEGVLEEFANQQRLSSQTEWFDYLTVHHFDADAEVARVQEWRRRNPEKYRAQLLRARQDPEAHEALIARNREWRAANPEKRSEQNKRSRERIKADPEKLARRREQNRLCMARKRGGGGNGEPVR